MLSPTWGLLKLKVHKHNQNVPLPLLEYPQASSLLGEWAVVYNSSLVRLWNVTILLVTSLNFQSRTKTGDMPFSHCVESRAVVVPYNRYKLRVVLMYCIVAAGWCRSVSAVSVARDTVFWHRGCGCGRHSDTFYLLNSKTKSIQWSLSKW